MSESRVFYPGCSIRGILGSDVQFAWVQFMGIQRTLFNSHPPTLFVAARMFDKFSQEELFAAVHHEAGHLRTVPQVVWCLADTMSLPMNMTLRIVAQLRMRLPVQLNVLARILYRLERGLYFVTMFAANHSDEYGADAQAALSHGTAEHLIAVLTRLHSFYKMENLAYMHFTKGEFTLDDEAHQHTHPMMRERIHRLLNLRKNLR